MICQSVTKAYDVYRNGLVNLQTVFRIDHPISPFLVFEKVQAVHPSNMRLPLTCRFCGCSRPTNLLNTMGTMNCGPKKIHSNPRVKACRLLGSRWCLRNFDRTHSQRSRSADCLAMSPLPNSDRTAGQGQGLQAAWQCHPCQTLIEPLAKGQGLQAAWQCHPCQTLIEPLAKGQVVCRLLGNVTPAKL